MRGSAVVVALLRQGFAPPERSRIRPLNPGGEAAQPAGLRQGKVSGVLAETTPPHELLPEGSDGPYPVRDLTLNHTMNNDGVAYTIKRGKIQRRDGTVFITEFDDSRGQSSSESVQDAYVQLVSNEHQAMPVEMRQSVKSYTTLLGRSPIDTDFEKYYGEDFIIDGQATEGAGNGGIILFNGDQPPPAGGQRAFLQGLIPHEGAHVFDASSGDVSESPGWKRAFLTPHRDIYDFTEKPRSKSLSPVNYNPDSDSVNHGVTFYGTSSPMEDFAEAVRLYLDGRIGTGSFAPGGPVQDLWFRDMFPDRARILDRLFPSVAQQQIREITTQRRLRGEPWRLSVAR